MSIWQRIFSAGARLFGPPNLPDRDGSAARLDDAGLVAALVALGAKMAKADGQVRHAEIAAFKRVFQASSDNEPTIARFFDLARQTTMGFERYAAIIAKRFRAQPAALEDVLDGLFHIALADGIVTEDEMSFLVRVGEIFGFSDREFRRIKIAHMGRASDDPYLILGVDEDISDVDLKRAYRRMAAANHPDRMVARGLPKELMKLANHKMAMVNKAYAEILAARKKQRCLTEKSSPSS
ncbi:molecular chaperone DjiA [Hellea balneolensis]|uniref:molecular chaperone DjiA n=1 Tax=Hellea balneolensis TaxID=287478 RepID=UPI000687B0F0|nr:molecular chaperone DjiA [Hellea balneolensis]